MTQTQALVQSLKKALKAHGLTYRQVANRLGLSETSVKRLFAEQHFSLYRLEQICQLMDMEMSELVKQMEAEQNQLNELTEAQENELIKDIKLLLVAFLVINGWRFEDITRFYNVSETETIRYLARLDRIKLIELQPNNRIKLRIAPGFSWRRNGPIQRFFTANLQDDFLKSEFVEKDEVFSFLSGMLTGPVAEQVRQRLKQLAREFRNLSQQEMSQPIREREGYSLFLAFRPWRPDVFDKLLK